MPAKTTKYTTEYFIKMAKKVHGDIYDYSKSVYKKTHGKLKIICPIDGIFSQTPHNHLAGQGCPKCGKRNGNFKNSNTIEQFINRAIKIHNNKYDYSRVVYTNCMTDVIIICPIHGKFLQTPNAHINQKQGCPKCGRTQKLTIKEFIIKARKIHEDKYDYSKADYVNGNTKVIIICPIDGKFSQKPKNHLMGKGCPKCGIETISLKKRSTTKMFIAKAQLIHGNKYNYGKVFYVNAKKDVIIGCPIHGKFSQKPTHHLNRHGCPICQSSKGEIKITKILDKDNEKYIKQKSFKDCINPKTKCRLKYDFYLPKHNILIEFNGLQHYMKNTRWHQNEETLEKQQFRDQIKKDYAIHHGYKFLVIKYNDNIEEIMAKVLATESHQL